MSVATLSSSNNLISTRDNLKSNSVPACAQAQRLVLHILGKHSSASPAAEGLNNPQKKHFCRKLASETSYSIWFLQHPAAGCPGIWCAPSLDVFEMIRMFWDSHSRSPTGHSQPLHNESNAPAPQPFPQLQSSTDTDVTLSCHSSPAWGQRGGCHTRCSHPARKAQQKKKKKIRQQKNSSNSFPPVTIILLPNLLSIRC